MSVKPLAASLTIGAVIAATFTASASATPVMVAQTSTPAHHDVTSPEEARRVDSVDVSNFAFGECATDRERHFKCAELAVPLDYDNPQGATYTVNVVKHPALKPDERIGSLFINPGGPTGSAAAMASYARWILPRNLVDKFDIIGVEPRGVGVNDPAMCFDDAKSQMKVLGLFDRSYPTTSAGHVRHFNGARKFGSACAESSSVHRHMSTAQVVRDIDVTRRALGEESLRFLGFSYGSAIGQYYANMFPDRVGAIVNDGVVNGPDWAGSKNGRSTVLDDRVGSARGAEVAFNEILRQCDEVGPEHCRAAANAKDPRSAVQKWADAVDLMKAGPVTYWYDYPERQPDGSVKLVRKEAQIYLKDTQAILLDGLTRHRGSAEKVTADIWRTWNALHNRMPNSPEAVAAGTEFHNAKMNALKEVRKYTQRDQLVAELFGTSTDAARAATDPDPDRPVPYSYATDSFYGVTCSDSPQPMTMMQHMRLANATAEASPNFGKLWAWETVRCSPDAWRAYDRSSFHGPFTKRTSGPMMFIGNLWDPSTNVEQAKTAAARRPGAKLIVSDSWGHTALRTSQCVDDAVANFLATGEAADTLHCVGKYQPFAAAKKATHDGVAHDGGTSDDYEVLPSPAIPMHNVALAQILSQD